MNSKYEWINTLLIAFAFSMCLFIFVDIAYDERVWEFGAFTLNARLQAISATTVCFYLLSYAFRQTANSFINRSKGEKRVNWKEYAVVFLISFILINIVHLFIMLCITREAFRWRESLLID